MIALPQKPSFVARWVGRSELESMLDTWNHLCQHAVYRNPSVEPNFLIPALRHLASDRVKLLIVEHLHASPLQRMVGLVPVEQKRIYQVPLKSAEIWKHDQCFDSTPLLCQNHAADVWQLICQKLAESGFNLFSLDTVSAEAPFENVLQHAEQRLLLKRFQRESFQRAAFRPEKSPEDYVQKHVSKSIRKNSRRLFRRLEDLGMVTWETSNAQSDYDSLARNFLQIESSGWKGQAATALASNPETTEFFRELIQRSARLGKARFLSLKLDGRPIAMLADIQSGDSVYSYKTAYDDEFSKYSPGQQIEVKNLEFLHRDNIAFGDSCTASDNSTINRIWGQKSKFQNVIFSLKPGLASLALRSLPLLQATAHRLRSLMAKSHS